VIATIRPATVADAAAVARLFGVARARMTYLPALHTADEDRAFFTQQLAQLGGLVAEFEGSVVAFAIHGPSRLDHLYVDPAWQGRRIGEALLTRVKVALPEGFDLWTFQGNAGARRFYERHDLRCVELTDGAENQERVPDARYEWRPRAGKP
jgi:GNAT superfamily N-acetyltransferase